MATVDNLKEAFAGESQANRKYLAFAKKADADGLPQVAKLFRAAAAAETVHAHAHLRVMGAVKTTAISYLFKEVQFEGLEGAALAELGRLLAPLQGNDIRIVMSKVREVVHDFDEHLMVVVLAVGNVPRQAIL